MSVRDVLADAAASIQRDGWHCVGVLPADDDSPKVPFTYTVGLWERYEHPELAIFALPVARAHAVLARCVELIQHGTRLRDGEVSNRVLMPPYRAAFRAIPTDDRHWPFGVAVAYYGNSPFPGLQIVLPSVDGLFPWEGADDAFASAQQQVPFLSAASEARQGRA